MEVVKKDAKFEGFENPGDGLGDFDLKILAGLLQVATKSTLLGTRIARRQKEAEGRGRILGGRQVLWLITERYHNDEDAGGRFEWEDLQALQNYSGGGDPLLLEQYIEHFDEVVENMDEPPGQKVIDDFFMKAMRKCPLMDHYVREYDTSDEKTRYHKVEYARGAADRVIAKLRKEKDREANKRFISGGGAFGNLKHKGDGKGLAAVDGGNPEGGKKTNAQKKADKVAAAAAKVDADAKALAASGGKDKGKGKGKDKGNGKGKADKGKGKGDGQPKSPRDKKTLPCFAFRDTGKCDDHAAGKCPYGIHKTKAQLDAAPGGSTPVSSPRGATQIPWVLTPRAIEAAKEAKGKILCKYFKAGYCGYSNCPWSHNPAVAVPAVQCHPCYDYGDTDFPGFH
jgi:hypothetical protein